MCHYLQLTGLTRSVTTYNKQAPTRGVTTYN